MRYCFLNILLSIFKKIFFILLSYHFCISNKEIIVFHSTDEGINKENESWEVIRPKGEINEIEINSHAICSL